MTEWRTLGIVRNMLPVLLALTVVELASGLVLDTFEETLLGYPSLLILVPVTIGMAGNLGSVLASRLSTALHLGLLSFDPTDDTLGGNAVATGLLAFTLFPLVGAGAWAIQASVEVTRLALSTVVLVAAASGAAMAALSVAVTLVATYAAYRLGLDPDDVVIPVVTNTCDVLGVLVLFGVVRLVL